MIGKKNAQLKVLLCMLFLFLLVVMMSFATLDMADPGIFMIQNVVTRVNAGLGRERGLMFLEEVLFHGTEYLSRPALILHSSLLRLQVNI